MFQNGKCHFESDLKRLDILPALNTAMKRRTFHKSSAWGEGEGKKGDHAYNGVTTGIKGGRNDPSAHGSLELLRQDISGGQFAIILQSSCTTFRRMCCHIPKNNV
jgi:hypothetical protein